MPSGIGAAWAFVRRYEYGDLAVGVGIDRALRPEVHAALTQTLDSMAIANVVTDGPSLLLVSTGTAGDVELRAADDDRLLVGPIPASDVELTRTVANVVRSFARSRYISRLEMEDPTVDVKLEVVPALHDFDFDGSCMGSEELPADAARSPGGQWLFQPGDGYLLRLTNQGRRPAYVTVLSLTPDGGISQLFPMPELSGQDNMLTPDRSFTIDLCYSAAEPYGVEILKLIATRERVDFRPILEGTGTGRSDAELTPLERLLADVQSGTRSQVSGPPRASGSTYSVTINVVAEGRRRP